jgi:hypothetical protein
MTRRPMIRSRAWTSAARRRVCGESPIAERDHAAVATEHRDDRRERAAERGVGIVDRGGGFGELIEHLQAFVGAGHLGVRDVKRDRAAVVLDQLEPQHRGADLQLVAVGEHVARHARAVDERAVARLGIGDDPLGAVARDRGVVARDLGVAEHDLHRSVATDLHGSFELYRRGDTAGLVHHQPRHRFLVPHVHGLHWVLAGAGASSPSCKR